MLCRNRADAIRVPTFFLLVLFICLWGCTRANPMFDGVEGDAGSWPDAGAPAAPELTSAADAPAGGDVVIGEAPAAAPRASAGHPRFASVGQKVYLDGSRSVVPAGCQLRWTADPQNPGSSTLSAARLPMLEVSALSPGGHRYTVTVACASGIVADTTAVYAFPVPLPTFPDRRFVYREGSVNGDNSLTGPKGRRFVFSPAQHPVVQGAITEVWLDVGGKRLKMSPSVGGPFVRWVPGAAASAEHAYWAFVGGNRYARAPVPVVQVQATSFQHTWRLRATAPLYRSFGGGAVSFGVYPHPGNATAAAITAGAGGEFLVAGKMSTPHRFYVVAFNHSHRSLPSMVTLPLRPAAPVGADLGVVYQIYLRQFADGDGDGVGDLLGLTAKLPYLGGLGVDTLLLMPIFASPGSVGLQSVPAGLSAVHADYGSRKDLGLMLRKAHALGMRVLVDLPLDRVHPTFSPCAKALGDPASPHAAWFHLFEGNSSWFGGGFADHASASPRFFAPGKLPSVALDVDHPDARAAMIRDAVALLDLDRDGKLDDGVDGFRLLGDGRVPADLWRQLAAAARQVSPKAALLGRVNGEAQELGQALNGAGLAAVEDTPFNRAVRRALRNHKAAGLYAHLVAWLKHYHKRGVVLPHATGDAGRVVTSLVGEGFGVAQAAATLALTAPGCPLLLAGDELGLLAQGGSDPERRYGGAFPWGSGDKHQAAEPGGAKLNKPPALPAQQANAHSLYAHHRGLIKVRRATRPLRDPAAPGYHYSELTDPGVFAMVRQSGKERALVVVNLTAAFKQVWFSERPKSTLLYRVGYGTGATLGPYGTHIYRLP